MDEDKLHRAILEAINSLDQTGQEITEEFLDIAGFVQKGRENGEADPVALRWRLEALTAEQAVLLEKVLMLEDMDNEELNARLKAVTVEKEDILGRLGALRQEKEQQAGQTARMDSLREFVEQQETKFAAYDDAVTRKLVEQVTVLDAGSICVKFRCPGLEIVKSLN